MKDGNSLHATGQPDTPVEVVTEILGRATKEADESKLRSLVDEAHRLVSGLEPYLESITTPPTAVRIAASGFTCLQCCPTSEVMASYIGENEVYKS